MVEGLIQMIQIKLKDKDWFLEISNETWKFTSKESLIKELNRIIELKETNGKLSREDRDE